MYNGIGLPTPRGSGTNGYVQRNFAFITNTKEKQLYKTEDDFSKVDSRNALFKEPNKDILLHERKRKIESKCLELCKNMEDQGYNDEEIQEKVSSYRRLLLNQLEDSNAPKIDILPETEVPCNRKGTHEMSELNKVKNFIFKEALGISEDFRDGTSMEVAQLRRKEAELSKKLLEAQKEMA
ncbi:unnamed protein product [Protopolystoma xenopodis]|uniref:CWF21 domain-containing protein n=1 Tax=Protopolystoma xenopodis TaxID=117903 RepID=A0A3S4ZE04_9PLAT|nr:unnamed protein product [Protopolystoma xenopodis]